jgi:ACR3 family arsenite transporter
MDNPSAAATIEPRRLAFFERYLTVWVLVCMVVGVAFGRLLPGVTATLSRLEFGQGSQVNVPIGVLLWLMIYPMMLKVDFSAIGGIAKRPRGLLVTLLVEVPVMLSVCRVCNQSRSWYQRALPAAGPA